MNSWSPESIRDATSSSTVSDTFFFPRGGHWDHRFFDDADRPSPELGFELGHVVDMDHGLQPARHPIRQHVAQRGYLAGVESAELLGGEKIRHEQDGRLWLFTVE